MMKRIISVVMILILALSLVGCGKRCEHEWTEASCIQPKTCSLCGETEGEPRVDDDAHIWIEATTEAPKTCSLCGTTEGDRIITDPRFTTSACQSLFDQWECDLSTLSESMGYAGVDMKEIYIFNNDGTYSSAAVYDEEAYREAIVLKSIEASYAPLLEQGYTREEVDQVVMEFFGYSTVEEYVRATSEPLIDQTMMIFDALTKNGVYYVDGDTLYLGTSWEEEFIAYDFVVDGDVLNVTFPGGIVYTYLRAGSDVKIDTWISGFDIGVLQNPQTTDSGSGTSQTVAGVALPDNTELGEGSLAEVGKYYGFN